MESSINSLSVSIKNAVNTTSQLIEYYDNNTVIVIFNPNATDLPPIRRNIAAWLIP